MTYWERELYWYGYWDQQAGRNWKYENESDQFWYNEGRYASLLDVRSRKRYYEFFFIKCGTMFVNSTNNVQIPQICDV